MNTRSFLMVLTILILFAQPAHAELSSNLNKPDIKTLKSRLDKNLVIEKNKQVTPGEQVSLKGQCDNKDDVVFASYCGILGGTGREDMHLISSGSEFLIEQPDIARCNWVNSGDYTQTLTFFLNISCIAGAAIPLP